jgi:hypothetical protein
LALHTVAALEFASIHENVQVFLLVFCSVHLGTVLANEAGGRYYEVVLYTTS